MRTYPIYERKSLQLCTKSSSRELIPLPSDPIEDCKHSLPSLDGDTAGLIDVIILDRHLKNQDYNQCSLEEQIRQLQCSLSDFETDTSTVTTCSLRNIEHIRDWYWSTYVYTIDVDTTKNYLGRVNSTELPPSILIRLLFFIFGRLFDKSILIYLITISIVP